MSYSNFPDNFDDSFFTHLEYPDLFLPLPDLGFPETTLYPEAVSSAPEATELQPKRVIHQWTPEQNQIVLDALEKANQGIKIPYKEIAERVNGLAGIALNNIHSSRACGYRFESFQIQALHKLVDPLGMMTKNEITHLLSQPITGDDLEKLKDLHNQNKTLTQISHELKRNPGVCKKAIQMLGKVNAGGDEVTPQTAVIADVNLLMLPDEVMPDDEFQFLNFDFFTNPDAALSAPQVTELQPKKVNHQWTPEQNQIILEALEKANQGVNTTYKEMAERVNGVVGITHNNIHTYRACGHRFESLQIQALHKLVDPLGIMTKDEIELQLKQPITGDDFEKLKDLHSQKKTLTQIARELKRIPIICKRAMQMLGKVNAGGDEVIPKSAAVADVAHVMQPDEVMPKSKRQRVDDKVPKQRESEWSPNQREIILEAIRNAKGEEIASKPISEAVNALAEKGDGKNHSSAACKNMIQLLRYKEALRQAVNPNNEMTEQEFSLHLKRPITGDDLEKLKVLISNGESIHNISIQLQRSEKVCQEAIKEHHLIKGVRAKKPKVLKEKIIRPKEIRSRPKKVSVKLPRIHKWKETWSDNQLKILREAIENSGGAKVTDTALILENVNKLAAEGDGKSHSKGAVSQKIKNLKAEIRKGVAQVKQPDLEKRMSDPEAIESSSKRMRVELPAKHKWKETWSENQLEILREAIKNSAGEKIKIDPVLEKINALAAEEDSAPHTRQACISKIQLIRIDYEVRRAIDPTDTMSSEKVEAQMNRPLNGDDLVFAHHLLKQGLSREQIAVILKRSYSICRKAFKW